MIAQWNDETSAHRKAIEKLLPGLIDLNKQGAVVELTKADATAIYTSKIDTQEWELRFHFVELLNYFEVIAVGYRNRVGDGQMIEESLRHVLIRWRKILRNFMEVVQEHRGYEPGDVHDRVVSRN